MDGQYLAVDFMTPLLCVAVAGVLLVGCLPMLGHAWYRRAKFRALPEGYQTYKLRSSIRTETIIGGLGLLLMVVLGVWAVVGFGAAARNLEANIEQRYHPAELTLGAYNGSWMNVDITLDDGASFSGTPVEIRAGNEPFIEDIWYHYNPKPAG